jgi:predicted nucleotidyltransferase
MLSLRALTAITFKIAGFNKLNNTTDTLFNQSMRLTQQQQTIINQKTRLIFGDNARVYLFGSRLDDNAKGGDIDLFIESTTAIESAVLKTLQLNSQLQQAFGLQKIDIVFYAPNYTWQAIHAIAKQHGILL